MSPPPTNNIWYRGFSSQQKLSIFFSPWRFRRINCLRMAKFYLLRVGLKRCNLILRSETSSASSDDNHLFSAWPAIFTHKRDFAIIFERAVFRQQMPQRSELFAEQCFNHFNREIRVSIKPVRTSFISLIVRAPKKKIVSQTMFLSELNLSGKFTGQLKSRTVGLIA